MSMTAIVDAQLAAYNARDVDAYCAVFADDAVLLRLDAGVEIGRGRAAIQRIYAARFAENPNLHCAILNRVTLGAFVVDHERVAGFEGRTVEVVAIYEVRGGLIQSVRFIWP